MNTLTNLAYHFVGSTLVDGSPVPRNGVWLRSPVQPHICEAGLHASRDPFDALRYAPGTTLCLVEVRDIVTEYTRKLVAWERKIVKRIDATELLQYFARMRAVSVLQYWTTEPPQVVLDWLMTGDDVLRESARLAAESAWLAARPASADWWWRTDADLVAVEPGQRAAWMAAQSAWSAVAGRSARAAVVAAESAAESAWSAAWPASASVGWWEAWSAVARAEFNLLVREAFE